MNSPDTQILIDVSDDFLSFNAEYFVHAFAGLNEIFQNSGSMNIVSEEKRFTVAVGIKLDYDTFNIDCMLLKPFQRSIRDCINILAKK